MCWERGKGKEEPDKLIARYSFALPLLSPPDFGAVHSSGFLLSIPGHMSNPRAGKGLRAHTCLAGGDARETPSRGKGCVGSPCDPVPLCPRAQGRAQPTLVADALQAAAHQGWQLVSPRPISGLSQVITA